MRLDVLSWIIEVLRFLGSVLFLIYVLLRLVKEDSFRICQCWILFRVLRKEEIMRFRLRKRFLRKWLSKEIDSQFRFLILLMGRILSLRIEDVLFTYGGFSSIKTKLLIRSIWIDLFIDFNKKSLLILLRKLLRVRFLRIMTSLRILLLR